MLLLIRFQVQSGIFTCDFRLFLPCSLQGFHRLLAFRDIQIEGKKPDLSTFHQYRSPQDFHIDQALIFTHPPGRTMNELSLLRSGTVAVGFCTILRRAYQCIQIATQDLGLRVAEQLFKGRVAGGNIAIEVSASHCDRANVHQGLKILLLIVDFLVQVGIVPYGYNLAHNN